MAASKKEVARSSGDGLNAEERKALVAADVFLSDMKRRDDERTLRMNADLKVLQGDMDWLKQNDATVEANAKAFEVEIVEELDAAAKQFLGIDEAEEKQEK